MVFFAPLCVFRFSVVIRLFLARKQERERRKRLEKGQEGEGWGGESKKKEGLERKEEEPEAETESRERRGEEWVRGGVLQLRAGWGAGGGVLVVMVVVAERTFLFEALLWAAMATSQLIFFSTESFLKEGQ